MLPMLMLKICNALIRCKNLNGYSMNENSTPDPVRKRYNRLAIIYDCLEAPLERFRFSTWRHRLPDHIGGHRVLEVGVGTGYNDQQRKDYDKSYVGKICSVQYNEIITSRDRDTKSLFLPVFVEFRDDKEEAD